MTFHWTSFVIGLAIGTACGMLGTFLGIRSVISIIENKDRP